MEPLSSGRNTVRGGVFWPSYLAFSCIGALSFLVGAPFITVLEHARDSIFSGLDWLFAYGTLAMVLMCIYLYLSPFASIKIGGPDAVPLLTKKQWFAISLCTTVAAGIMFWATSEPLIHLYSPPESLHLAPNSKEAEQFALATLFHHWSITPSAIYTVPALAFALAIYNLKQPFSLASIFAPLLGSYAQKYSRLIDGICVFALVAGMAGSLGTGAMTISGSFEHYFSSDNRALLLGLVIAFLVICFTASATSGLMKGIRILSDLNVKAFILMVVVLFALGPTRDILASSLDSLMYFGKNFFSMSTFIKSTNGDSWPHKWPIFYWSSWLSWAPITAVFLGRISYGHTIKDFMHINLFAPALFSCIWTGVFGASALSFERLEGSLYAALKNFGPNAVSYEMINRLPFAPIITLFFVFITFLSYVTAADSTTDAISSLCTKHKSGELLTNASNALKITWAVTIGFVSWVLVAHSGIEGMKLLSSIGGLPALFLILGAAISLLKMKVVDLKTHEKNPAPALNKI